MHELWPSLQTIHARFQADNVAPAVPVSLMPDSTPPEMAQAAALPDPPTVLKHLFARRAAAESHLFAPSPNVGQVVLIEDRTANALPFALAILLDEQIGPDKWGGWLVAPDTDYAAYWDVVLDHRDEPFDPEAGMIQIWNPVFARIPAGVKVLAQMPSERLATIRLVASEHASSKRQVDEAAHPGHIAPRSLLNGEVVLTGTPLGDSSDPRRIYQSLYSEAATRLCSNSPTSNVVVFPHKAKDQGVHDYANDAFAAAALIQRGNSSREVTKIGRFGIALLISVMINTALLIAVVILLRSVQHAENIQSQEPSSGIQIEVKFKSSARVDQVQRAIQNVGGRIIDGPDGGGRYVIEIPVAVEVQALDSLRTSDVVESVKR